MRAKRPRRILVAPSGMISAPMWFLTGTWYAWPACCTHQSCCRFRHCILPEMLLHLPLLEHSKHLQYIWCRSLDEMNRSQCPSIYGGVILCVASFLSMRSDHRVVDPVNRLTMNTLSTMLTGLCAVTIKVCSIIKEHPHRPHSRKTHCSFQALAWSDMWLA